MKHILTIFVEAVILIGLSAVSVLSTALIFRLLWEALKFGWTVGGAL